MFDFCFQIFDDSLEIILIYCLPVYEKAVYLNPNIGRIPITAFIFHHLRN
jgi:hypothetical protein